MAHKSIKDTIREAMKSGKNLKPSEAQDPFFIGEEDIPEEPNAIDEMTTDSNEVDFADFEKDGQDSNQEPRQKETVKDLAVDTSEEAPPEEPLEETEAADTGTRTEDLTAGSEEATDTPPAKGTETPPASTQRYKVRTVDGDEEVTLEEMRAGYMKGKHYTQSQQILHEKERRISSLLSSPEKLVEFAIQNGVDLKPLVHAQPSIPEVKIPPLPEYATDEQKQQHAILVALADSNRIYAEKVAAIERENQRFAKDQQWGSVEREFEENRGDLPKAASFAISLFMREGRKQFGDKYTMQQAVKDLKIAHGDIYQRAFESPEGKKRIEKIKRDAVSEYLRTKKTHEAESASGDIMPTTKAAPQVPKQRFKSAREGAEAAKKLFGIISR